MLSDKLDNRARMNLGMRCHVMQGESTPELWAHLAEFFSLMFIQFRLKGRFTNMQGKNMPALTVKPGY